MSAGYKINLIFFFLVQAQVGRCRGRTGRNKMPYMHCITRQTVQTSSVDHFGEPRILDGESQTY